MAEYSRNKPYQPGSHAILLVNCEIGKDDEVLAKLRKVKWVKEAYAVYGVYDIVAKVEADTPENLKEVVSGQEGIRQMDGVRSTLTSQIVDYVKKE